MQQLLLVSTFVISLAAAAVAGAADLSQSQMLAARRLYVSKCARCHKFYDPANYSDSEWRQWMDRMGRKAKLKPDEHELLSRYLDTIRGTNQGSIGRPAGRTSSSQP